MSSTQGTLCPSIGFPPSANQPQVKCDERPGVCLNCERLHLECQRADGSKAAPPAAVSEQLKSSQSPGTPLGDVGVKRKRTFRSCVHCRASKARCSGQKPSCTRCIQRNVACVYDEDSAPQWTRVVQQPDVPTDTSPHAGDSTTQVGDDATSPHENTTENRAESPARITMSIESPAYTALTRPPTTAVTISTAPLRRSASVRADTADEGPDSLEW